MSASGRGLTRRGLVFGLLVTIGACRAATSPPQRAASPSPGGANFDSGGNDYVCLLSPSPSSLTVYVGHSTGLSGGAYLCLNGSGSPQGNTTAYFTSNNSSIASVSPTHDVSTTVTGVADGSTSVNVVACFDSNGNCISQTVPVTVQHAPLAAGVSGPTSVATGPTCTFNAGASGGYPPYSYSWSADGTITGGATSSSVSVQFTSDGTHLVSVTVTDAQSHQSSAGLYVNSSSPSPPPIQCDL